MFAFEHSLSSLDSKKQKYMYLKVKESKQMLVKIGRYMSQDYKSEHLLSNYWISISVVRDCSLQFNLQDFVKACSLSVGSSLIKRTPK